jgi:hypothetical protein
MVAAPCAAAHGALAIDPQRAEHAKRIELE